jgi:predicted RNA-binding protein with PUA-like domain
MPAARPAGTEAPMAARYWLLKSDPDTFGIEHLAKAPRRRTVWDGVRNFQARNMLRDDVRAGDGVFLYHSGEEKAVVGTCLITKAGFPDPTQFDRKHHGFDADSDPQDPRWYAVEIVLDRVLATPVTLAAMRKSKVLANMVLLKKGSRLSVQPVTPAEWAEILRMAGA